MELSYLAFHRLFCLLNNKELQLTIQVLVEKKETQKYLRHFDGKRRANFIQNQYVLSKYRRCRLNII